jgi:hypothetical protein
MANSNPPSNPILEWLWSQWFFLSALVVGAGHAATAQSKISRHEDQLKDLSEIPERLARIETHQEHILEVLRGKGG